MRVPLSRLVLQDNEPPVRLGSLAYFIAQLSAGHELPPIEVEAVQGDFFRIRNGRHRFLASVILGVSDLACEPIRRGAARRARPKDDLPETLPLALLGDRQSVAV